MTGTPFDDLDDEDESSEKEPEQANTSFEELRKAYKRAERERKALAVEAEELRTFKSTIVEKERSTLLETILKENGLSPKHATLFAKINPEAEITAETVLGFAKEYDLVTTDGERVEAPEGAPAGFNPISTGVGGDLKQYTREELDVLIYTNPELANKLVETGRVSLTRTPKE